ncbi:MAG TPA: hypothetical protein VFU88_21930 [Ktedonobacterales bacterium]|nr:hypothetical protein [Ktedonobacterales bacterium]
MAIIRDFLRFIGLVVGLLAGVLGLLVDLGSSVVAHATNNASHGFIGFLIVGVGIVGALMAVFWPRASALLMLISAIAFFFVVGPVAAVSAVLFVIAAALAYFDRGRAKAKAQAA